MRPRVASDARSSRVAARASFSRRVIFGPLLRVRQDIMCRLNDEELRVGLVLSSWVAVRMVFQCCGTGQQVFTLCTLQLIRHPKRALIRTKLPVLLLDFRRICSWRNLQVCIIIPSVPHDRLPGRFAREP